MKRSVVIVAASLVATLGIWWAPQIFTSLRERSNAERTAVAYLGSAAKLEAAAKEQQDAIEVLTGAHLHPAAALHLRKAMDRTRLAADMPGRLARNALIRLAMLDQAAARKDMVE